MTVDAWVPPASPSDDGPLVTRLGDAEAALLSAVGAPRERILEFGCGGSTAIWLRHPVRTVVSVESDPAWIARVTGHPDLARHVQTGRLKVHHADIGPVGDWGHPAGIEHVDAWPTYWSSVWELDAVTGAPAPDLVFVDGRFRVACALNGALRMAPGGHVAIHDFWSREPYHVLLEHLGVVATVDDLVVLQRRQDFDADAVTEALDTVATDPR